MGNNVFPGGVCLFPVMEKKPYVPVMSVWPGTLAVKARMSLSDSPREISGTWCRHLPNRDDFERNHLSMAFGGGIYTRPLDNLDRILTEVDKRMYEDKKNSRERRLPETSGTEHQEK